MENWPKSASYLAYLKSKIDMLEYLKIEGVSSEDLVVTISSSGNSSNILNVLEYCKKEKINTLALSGLKENNKSINLL